MRALPLALATLLLVGPAPAQEPDSAEEYQNLAGRFHQLVTRRPRKGTGFDLLYRFYLDAGKLDELQAHYEQAIADDPQAAAAHIVLGLIYERRGRLDEALQTYRRAGQLTPDDYYPDYLLGILQSRQHRYDRAMRAFEGACPAGAVGDDHSSGQHSAAVRTGCLRRVRGCTRAGLADRE